MIRRRWTVLLEDGRHPDHSWRKRWVPTALRGTLPYLPTLLVLLALVWLWGVGGLVIVILLWLLMLLPAGTVGMLITARDRQRRQQEGEQQNASST